MGLIPISSGVFATDADQLHSRSPHNIMRMGMQRVVEILENDYDEESGRNKEFSHLKYVVFFGFTDSE